MNPSSHNTTDTNFSTGRSKVGAILRVTSGNFLEQFDFFLFGFYATYISKVFFPSYSEFASLMLTFVVFAAGFLMRPLGAIILGAYIDKVGRRKGLVVTLTLMAAGTLLIACVPGYATIGITAPMLVLTGRLLQGFSAGAELGGVSVYLAEIATPGRKGFYTSWQSASQQISIILASVLGYVLNEMFTGSQILAFAWRIPFFIGCLIVPLLFILRRSLDETDEFKARSHRPDTKEVFKTTLQNLPTVLAGMCLIAMTTTTFYFITVYTPTFGKTVLKLTTADSLIVTIVVAVSNFIWLPIGGTLSDRFGRRPVLSVITIMAVVTAYPTMSWLASAPSVSHLAAVLLLFSFYFGVYNGTATAALTEVMPEHVRVAGFSLAYSLATAVFGGLTPAISTYLIQMTRDPAAASYWLCVAALCGFSATQFLYRKASQQSAERMYQRH
ncbi:major facilitator transporter [Caballeronia peredens]|nr:major facilitator transporter [Caballeronia peredens]